MKTLDDLLKENGFGNIKTHNERYLAIANLLNFKEVVSCIPFTLDQLVKSYQEDEHFNTSITPMKFWDTASGFANYDRTGHCLYTGSKLTNLYHSKGVYAYSNSEGVCILKCVARKLVLDFLGGNNNANN